MIYDEDIRLARIAFPESICQRLRFIGFQLVYGFMLKLHYSLRITKLKTHFRKDDDFKS
jgi:hypothetical protein